jgi:hypothetical protein
LFDFDMFVCGFAAKIHGSFAHYRHFIRLSSSAISCTPKGHVKPNHLVAGEDNFWTCKIFMFFRRWRETRFRMRWHAGSYVGVSRERHVTLQLGYLVS